MLGYEMDKTRNTLTYTILLILTLTVSNYGYAQKTTHTLVLQAPSWNSTGADNDLLKDPSLFGFVALKKGNRIRTTSELTNIHSHYKGKKYKKLKNIRYSGQMRILESNGGVGVTFYSKYPKSDTYYRLRRFSSNEFHIVPHGTSITDGVISTGVTPSPNTWYNFRILTKTAVNRTRIRAKVWAQGETEPSGWQVDCYDDSDTRIKNGRLGVWSMGDGTKEWRNLKVIY